MVHRQFDEASKQSQDQTKSLSEETTRLQKQIDESKKFPTSTDNCRTFEQCEEIHELQANNTLSTTRRSKSTMWSWAWIVVSLRWCDHRNTFGSRRQLYTCAGAATTSEFFEPRLFGNAFFLKKFFSARRKIESYFRSQLQFFFTGACFHAKGIFSAIAANRAAFFQQSANTITTKESIFGPENLAGRNLSQSEKRLHGSTHGSTKFGLHSNLQDLMHF